MDVLLGDEELLGLCPGELGWECGEAPGGWMSCWRGGKGGFKGRKDETDGRMPSVLYEKPNGATNGWLCRRPSRELLAPDKAQSSLSEGEYRLVGNGAGTGPSARMSSSGVDADG